MANARSTTYFFGPTFLGPIKETQQRAINMFKNMFEKVLKKIKGQKCHVRYPLDLCYSKFRFSTDRIKKRSSV